MRLLDTEQQQHTARVEALIRARITAHAEQIAYEALQSRAVAIPYTIVAHTLLATAHAGSVGPQAFHAAAAIELIRAGAAMHRRLFSHAHPDYAASSDPSPLHGPTLMLGDYFFAMAASEMAETPNARIIAEYSTCVMDVAEAFLQTPPFDHSDIITQVLATLNHIEGRIMRSAINAGLECAQVTTHTIDVAALSTHLTRLVSLHVHLQQVNDPFDTLDRGTIILPVAYALDCHRAETLKAIATHNTAHLQHLIHLCDGVTQTQALCVVAQQEVQRIIATIPYEGVQARLTHLIAQVATPTTTP